MPGKSFHSFTIAVWSRGQTEWRLKIVLTIALNLVFWIGYGVLSRHSFMPLQTIPLTWLDHAIPFQPEGWSWIYMSEFLLTATVPWLIARREMLWRYVRGVGLLSLISFAIFATCPVASPRSPGQSSEGMFGFILALDGPLNAFPSLHAGFLVFTLGVAARVFRRQAGWAVNAFVLTWATGVMYATIATRQQGSSNPPPHDLAQSDQRRAIPNHMHAIRRPKAPSLGGSQGCRSQRG